MLPNLAETSQTLKPLNQKKIGATISFPESLDIPLNYFLLWPRWPRSCILKFPKLAKRAEQNLHLWGFSPVWTFLCSWRCCFVAKPLQHISHLYFFWSSGVCADRICWFILEPFPINFPQWVQGTFSCWYFSCAFR